MYIVKKNSQDKWIVIEEGKKRASKIFTDKSSAIDYAEKLAKKKKTTYRVETTVTRKQKHKIKTFMFLVTAILVVGVVLLLYFGIIDINKFLPNKKPTIEDPITDVPTLPNDPTPVPTPPVPTPPVSDEGLIVENITYENFQIHFMTMGDSSMSTDYSKYSGDAIYIKAGENDILIDAGSRQGSAEYITKYVNKYCKDGVLEYVIATHADQDHISGFVGTTSAPGIFKQYEIEVLIDFAKTDKDTQLYNKYVSYRNELIASGTQHFTAADCWNNEAGAKRIYELADGITMEILYNKYYFNSSSDENNYSVCTMFKYNEEYYMFTGDLEIDGETALAAYYDGSTPDKTLPQVKLFKAGHHGSKTSTNDCLLEKIQPEIVCVCCCAGSTEYTANYNNIFPTQDFINRVAKYTDRVYVTSVLNEATKKPEKLNGDIIISSDGKNVGIFATNNIIKLKDTIWFNQIVYVKADGSIVSGKGKDDFYDENTSGASAVPRRTWPTN